MKYQRITNILKNNLPVEKGLIISRKELENYKNASHIALAVLGSVGAVALSLIAPNMLLALNTLLKKKRGLIKEREDYKEVARIFTYLKRHKLIKLRPKGVDYEISLTGLGKQKLTESNFKTLKVNNKLKWDGFWWQIAADIPTQTHRAGADLFRRKLKKMGFFALQKSLWFYPYDPRIEIQFICDHYGLGQYVTVMEISRMDVEDEKVLLDYFKPRKIV